MDSGPNHRNKTAFLKFSGAVRLRHNLNICWMRLIHIQCLRHTSTLFADVYKYNAKTTTSFSHLDKEKTLSLVKSICGKVDAVKIGRGHPVLPLSFGMLSLIRL